MNEQTQSSINRKFREMEDKIFDPATSEKATLWNNKATTIQSQFEEVFNFIDDIKLQLKKDRTELNDIFTADKTNQIKNKLISCKSTLLSVDTILFNKSIPLIDKNVDDISFKHLGKPAAIVKLSQIQADLRTTENMFIEYCNRRIPIMDDGYSVYQVIATANNYRYYPGEKAKIYAGIGVYSSLAGLNIMIGDHKAARTPFGDYLHTFKVSTVPGNYSIPVKVDYTDPNTRTKASVTKIIQYTVVEKCP